MKQPQGVNERELWVKMMTRMVKATQPKARPYLQESIARYRLYQMDQYYLNRRMVEMAGRGHRDASLTMDRRLWLTLVTLIVLRSGHVKTKAAARDVALALKRHAIKELREGRRR